VRPQRPRFATLLDAAYRVGGSDDDWLSGVVDVAQRAFGGDVEIAIYGVDSRDHVRLIVRQPATSRHDLERIALEWGVRAYKLARSPGPRGRALASVRERVGDARQETSHGHVVRTLAINVCESDGVGCAMSISIEGLRPLTRRTIDRGKCMAVHLLGEFRLRWAAHARASEAVSAHEAFRGTAVAAVSAADPRSTVPAPLVLREIELGRWSLVDRFEQDGRQYVVARKIPSEGSMRLTPRECRAIALAARGHSDKVIGFALGITASSVGTHLSVAAAKLGVRSRIELVQICAALGASDGDEVDNAPVVVARRP
jgi:DNA-binding CsgD family transcriptional regulator